MNRSRIKNYFTRSNKVLYIVLGIVLVSVFSLTVVYAALSVTLNIVGNADIVASNWDIHLENPNVSSGSVTNTLPVISGNTMTFSSSLTTPGDYYEFTVDVVNDGTIDAMIDNVVITPELTTEQKKYLRHEVTYQNGEDISSKQLLKKQSSMPIKFRVEFRNDISASDLPSTETKLNHTITLVYTQDDGTSSSVVDDGVYIPFKVGNEYCIGDECFYVISSDENNVTLLAKYNLYVGTYSPDGSIHTSYGEEATGIQNSLMRGFISSTEMRHGVTFFATEAYWSGTVSSYPAYILNENSNIYGYLENYKTYLMSIGATINEIRTIKLEELESFGCSLDEGKCIDTPLFIYSTSYLVGTAVSDSLLVRIRSDNKINTFNVNNTAGVRPVINTPKWQFADEIEFFIYNSVYTAKEGMTWEDWINSDYCITDQYGIVGDYIGNQPFNDGSGDYHDNILYNEDCDETGEVCGLGQVVLKSDVIVPGHVYATG